MPRCPYDGKYAAFSGQPTRAMHAGTSNTREAYSHAARLSSSRPVAATNTSADRVTASSRRKRRAAVAADNHARPSMPRCAAHTHLRDKGQPGSLAQKRACQVPARHPRNDIHRNLQSCAYSAIAGINRYRWRRQAGRLPGRHASREGNQGCPIEKRDAQARRLG